jgi:hypothetical protein
MFLGTACEGAAPALSEVVQHMKNVRRLMHENTLGRPCCVLASVQADEGDRSAFREEALSRPVQRGVPGGFLWPRTPSPSGQDHAGTKENARRPKAYGRLVVEAPGVEDSLVGSGRPKSRDFVRAVHYRPV